MLPASLNESRPVRWRLCAMSLALRLRATSASQLVRHVGTHHKPRRVLVTVLSTAKSVTHAANCLVALHLPKTVRSYVCRLRAAPYCDTKPGLVQAIKFDV
ncbi:hypothetical protein BD310DRAFT_919534, partial [Dichomitus squalens]